MSDILGGLFIMTITSVACLTIAVTDQYKLEKERKKRELQLIKEQEIERAQEESIARYAQEKRAHMLQSIKKGAQVQMEIDRYARERSVVTQALKSKAKRKYGRRHA